MDGLTSTVGKLLFGRKKKPLQATGASTAAKKVGRSIVNKQTY
jgi:hypothetical protein